MVAASRMGPRRLRLGPGGVGPVPHWRVGSCPGAGRPSGGSVGSGKWTCVRLLCRSCPLSSRRGNQATRRSGSASHRIGWVATGVLIALGVAGLPAGQVGL
jgi:hypothetical protein